MIQGIFPALLTPFNEGNSVDFNKLEEHIEFLIQKGIHGLFILGTTGEGILMSVEERKSVTEFILNTVNNRIPTIVHVGEQKLEDIINLSKHAEKNNAYGIASITPYFFQADDNMIFQFYEDILGSISEEFPLFIYNNPNNARNAVSYDNLFKLIDKYPNIKGIKNSPNDFEQVMFLTENLPSAKTIFVGPESFFFPGLCVGTSGNISGIANVYPELYVKLFDAFSNNEIKYARRLQKFINEATSILLNDLSYLKHGLEFRGLQKSKVRKPFLDMKEQDVEKLFAKLESFEKEINSFDNDILI